jgi:hypothetical protein
MPVPGWGEDHVAAGHSDAFAVNSGESACAFDDEAHCEGCVAVGAGCFIGEDELKACVEGICCERGVWSR